MGSEGAPETLQNPLEEDDLFFYKKVFNPPVEFYNGEFPDLSGAILRGDLTVLQGLFFPLYQGLTMLRYSG